MANKTTSKYDIMTRFGDLSFSNIFANHKTRPIGTEYFLDKVIGTYFKAVKISVCSEFNNAKCLGRI